MTTTKTRKVTSWIERGTADGRAIEGGKTVVGPGGREMVAFGYSDTTLTSDDHLRELSQWARSEHRAWECTTEWRGLIGHGDGWWAPTDQSVWYRIA